METWDIYDGNRVKSNRTHVRGTPLAPGDYHLVVVIWIVTPEGKIVVTKRHPDKPYPNYWECTGGAVVSGESSADGAVREVREEIGIRLRSSAGRLLQTYRGDDTFYDYWIFIEKVDLGKTRLQAEEVVDIKLVSKAELRAMFDRKEMIPSLAVFLELLESDEILN